MSCSGQVSNNAVLDVREMVCRHMCYASEGLIIAIGNGCHYCSLFGWVGERRTWVTHLLLVESWVGAMGTLLPRAVADAGVEFTFLTRRPEHYPESLPDGSPHPLRRGRAVVTAETNDPIAAVDAARRIHADEPITGF